MSDILNAKDSLTIESLQHALAQGEVTATQTADSFLQEIENKADIGAFITVTDDLARSQASASDARRAAGETLPLDGVPIAVKDNYCVSGVRTTAASKILQDFVPEYESTVTQRLRDAGAVIVGKANLDEFAMGSSTEHSHFGPTKNPTAQRLGLDNIAPGGSSGGSAAAVAGNMALGALGTDTGGSIRQPSAFCGVVGFKPTYGVCSRWGIIAYGSSLDQAGVFAKSVTDAAKMMDVIKGPDDKDSTSLPQIDLNYADAARDAGRVRKIGLPKEVLALDSTADADIVWDRARALASDIGAELVDISLPHFKYALPAYYVVALCEASSNLARYDGVRYGYRHPDSSGIVDMYEKTRAEGFGAEVKRRLMLGAFALSAGYYDAYYLRALRVRALLAQEFAAAFQQVDVMAMPTTPSAAFEIGSHSADPVQMYLEDIFTVPVNMAGLPAMSLPVATNAQGLPLGLQLIGPQLGDEKVFDAARQMELAVAS